MVLNGAAQCTATAKSTGKRCKNPAVAGYRVCRLHGAGNANKGKQGGRPIVHGRYSFKHAASLQGKVQEYLADPEPGNLLHELALMRALLQDFLDKMTDGAVDARSRGYAFEMAESISRTVERIAKIQNQTALTSAEVAYITARLSDLIVKYIDDPAKRAAFIEELTGVVGTRAEYPAARYELASGVD